MTNYGDAYLTALVGFDCDHGCSANTTCMTCGKPMCDHSHEIFSPQCLQCDQVSAACDVLQRAERAVWELHELDMRRLLDRSIAACRHHRVESDTSGDDLRLLIDYTETCRCGAVRDVTVRADGNDFGTWRNPL